MPPPRRKETTEVQRAKVLTWYIAGRTIWEIVIEEGIPRAIVYNIIRRAREHPNHPIKNTEWSGGPGKLTETAKRKLVRHATLHSWDTIAAIWTPGKSGVHLSRNTVRRTLAASGVYRRKAWRKPFLKQEHQKERLRWCREYKRFTKKIGGMFINKNVKYRIRCILCIWKGIWAFLHRERIRAHQAHQEGQIPLRGTLKKSEYTHLMQFDPPDAPDAPWCAHNAKNAHFPYQMHKMHSDAPNARPQKIWIFPWCYLIKWSNIWG